MFFDGSFVKLPSTSFRAFNQLNFNFLIWFIIFLLGWFSFILIHSIFLGYFSFQQSVKVWLLGDWNFLIWINIIAGVGLLFDGEVFHVLLHSDFRGYFFYFLFFVGIFFVSLLLKYLLFFLNFACCFFDNWWIILNLFFLFK